jgi:hypothetical protein
MKKAALFVQIMLSFLAIAVIVTPNVEGYAIHGNYVFKDRSLGNMTVWPHTVINPHLSWQYFQVHSKHQPGDICVAYVFDHQLQSTSVQYLNTNNNVWVNVKDQFNYVVNGTDHIYYLEDAYSFDTYDNVTWRIKYKPNTASGKWDLLMWNSQTTDCKDDYLNGKYDFLYELDPWWNTADQNITQGFVYLTNNSLTDTFEYYDWLLINSFDSTVNISLVHDGQNLTAVTDRMQGNGSIYYEMNASLNTTLNFSRLEFGGELNLDLSSYDRLVVYLYTNDSDNVYQEDDGRIMTATLYDDSGTTAETFHVDNTTYDLYSNWQQIEFDISLWDFANNSNISRIRLTTYNNNQSDNIQIRLDNLYAYNSTSYYNTARWTNNADNNFTYRLEPTDNGFGFNTTALANAVYFTAVLGGYDEVHFPIDDYVNFEVIWKAKEVYTESSDLCIGSIYNENGGAMFIGFYNEKIRSDDDDGNDIQDIESVALDTWIYFRIVVNDSWVSHYYSWNLSTPEGNWTLAQNYTMDSKTNEYFTIRTRRAYCNYDNVIIRELLPDYVPLGDYHASFVYDSSNATQWNRTFMRTYKDGVLDSSDNYYESQDTDITTWTYTLDSGVWDFRVGVYDTDGNQANNYTQEVTVGLGSLNMTFYDEDTSALLDFITIEVDLVSDAHVDNLSTSTGNLLASDIAVGTYTIIYTGTDYSTKSYSTTVTLNTTTNVNLYMMNTTTGQTILVNIYDQTGNPLEGMTLKTMRLIDGVWTLVEISTTNSNGETDFYGLLNTPLYYWLIEDDGVLLRQTEETEIYATTLDFYVVISAPIGDLFNTIQDLVYTLDFDNSSNSFIFNYDDTSNTMTNAKLIVTETDGTTTASTASSSSSGILTIDMSSLYVNGTTYFARAYVDYGSGDQYIDVVSHTYPAAGFRAGRLGLLATAFIVILIGFIGLWNPSIMLILEGVAFILTRIAGLHTFSHATVVVVVIVCLISAYIMSDRT